MAIALMLHSENSAVGKYRIWTPAKYLDRLDSWEVRRIPNDSRTIKIDHASEGDGCWECLGNNIDILIMQRPDNPDSIALAMALREQFNVPLVMEMDDNIFDVSENSTSYQYWYPGSPLIEMSQLMMSQADALTVSTPELREVYKKYNDNIYVLPNYQDREDWDNVANKGHEANLVRVGWQGSSTHYDDLYMIRRPLKKLLRNYPNVQFYCMGLNADFLQDNPQITVDLNGVEPWRWPKKLARMSFDIGLAPVVDRPFNRGKSNIKWQEYSMLSVPTIASKVGEYKAITPNETGVLADSEDSWYFHLEKLVQDRQLRESLGKNARAYVHENLTIDKQIHRWSEAYQDIIERFKTKTG